MPHATRIARLNTGRLSIPRAPRGALRHTGLSAQLDAKKDESARLRDGSPWVYQILANSGEFCNE
jgi:hypothetical protein